MPSHSKPVRLLVLMAKFPQPGRVKTRLVPPLTEAQSADLYHAFLQDKIAQMRGVAGVQRAIAYTPPAGRSYFAALAPGFILVEQAGPDLAARLTNLFDTSFTGDVEQVIAIDGDTPTLPPDYLRRGFKVLEDPAVDVALGPCEDGGYYAIGMKRLHATLFNVTVSTPHVTRDTLARAAEAGLSVHCLPEWWDVDRPDDLARLKVTLSAGRNANEFTAPSTRRQLLAEPPSQRAAS